MREGMYARVAGTQLHSWTRGMRHVWRYQQVRGEKAWTHAGLVVVGSAVAVVIYAASWAAVGPWEFERERLSGSPPDGSMEKGPP